MAELKKVLDAVDAMPKRLLISVRQQALGTGLDNEAEVSGSIGAGDVRATVPGSRNQQGGTVVIRKGDNIIRGHAISSQSASTERGVQTVQVLEGNEATIRVGQSVPIRSQSVIQTPQGPQISQSVEYHDADTGFRVRPRVQGERVTLEINSRHDTVGDPKSKTFDVQHVETIVSGRLGEWLEIGGVDQGGVQTDSGIAYRRGNTTSDGRKVLLKVEVLP